MMIDLEQLKADREAGTAGTWKWEKNRYGYFVELVPSVIEPEEQLDLSDADARRIARLPELESAYIEVVAKLGMVVEVLEKSRDTFKRYGDLHSAKKTRDADQKAAVNWALSMDMDEALAAIKGAKNDQ